MVMQNENPDGSQLTDEQWDRISHGSNGNNPETDKMGSDGLLSRQSPERQGVLVRAMRAHKMIDFEQELKTAGFEGTDEGDELVAAWNECMVLNMDPTPLYHQMLARSAGAKNNRLYEIFRTMTHQSRTVNYPKGYKPDQKNNDLL